MEECEAIVRRKLEEISEVQQNLMSKEENLEDEINDIFANITALLEDRRKDVIAQLRSRVDGKCQRLGIKYLNHADLKTTLIYSLFRQPRRRTKDSSEIRIWSFS